MHLSSDELGTGYQDANRTACIVGLSATTTVVLAPASGDAQGGMGRRSLCGITPRWPVLRTAPAFTDESHDNGRR